MLRRWAPLLRTLVPAESAPPAGVAPNCEHGYFLRPPNGEDVKPIEICNHLGPERVDAFYNELSGKEVRAVLKAGGSHSGVPSTVFSRAQRLKSWRKRFDAEFERGNEQLALALLVEWLMHHHREMLIDYLDHLEVPHRGGETDEDFCETRTPEQLRAGVEVLLKKYPAHEVAVYLLLVGHLQETPVFDQTPAVLEALGLSSSDAAAYVESHQQTFPSAEGAA